MRTKLLLVALMLVAAACGGEGPAAPLEPGTTAAGEPGTTAAGEPATTPAGEPGTTAVGAAPGAPCAPDQVDGDLNFYNWSEYIDPELISAFEEQYGVDVVESFYESNEAMLAQLQAGVVYDLVVPSDYMIAIMIEEGLLMELQRDAIPNLANLDPQFTSLPYDSDGSYSAAYQWGTTGLGIDTAVVGEDFQPSWSLVFGEEIGYSVSLLNDPRETLGAALKFLGYSLNTTDEAHLQEAAQLIAENRDHIVKFDSDQYTTDLVNGEVAVSHGYSGNFFAVFAEAEDPDQYAYVVPQEGGTVWVDNMAVPTVSEAPCTAHTFMNFLLDAENGGTLTNWNYYASPNAAAEEFILEEVLEDPTIYPDDELQQRLEFITNTGDFEIKFTDYFAQARS